MDLNSAVLALIADKCRVPWSGMITTSPQGDWKRSTSDKSPNVAYFIKFFNIRGKDFPENAWIEKRALPLSKLPVAVSTAGLSLYLDAVKKATESMNRRLKANLGAMTLNRLISLEEARSNVDSRISNREKDKIVIEATEKDDVDVIEASEVESNEIEIKRDSLARGFVLAKYGGYPYWPAYIGKCTIKNDDREGKYKLKDAEGSIFYWVFFLNSYTGEWIQRENIAEFNNSNLTSLCPVYERDSELQGAIDETMDRIEEKSSGSWRRKQSTSRNQLKLNDLVIAKVDAYPPWPAMVVPDTQNIWKKADNNMESLHLVFLAEVPRTTRWVEISSLTSYSKAVVNKTTVRENNILYSDYTSAVQEADQHIKNRCSLHK